MPQLMKDEDLVGIKSNREQLTKLLRSDTRDLKVVSVCGMGGMGKTTLVANVYEKQKDKFLVHVWLTVSQTYNSVEALLRKLLEMTGPSEELGTANVGGIERRRNQMALTAWTSTRLKQSYSKCLDKRNCIR
uniref:NB-ARC domain-containing protein n=1 Tax=Arundo donax TaxID=35708 RepID=A0A0A9D0K0_ARUDO